MENDSTQCPAFYSIGSQVVVIVKYCLLIREVLHLKHTHRLTCSVGLHGGTWKVQLETSRSTSHHKGKWLFLCQAVARSKHCLPPRGYPPKWLSLHGDPASVACLQPCPAAPWGMTCAPISPIRETEPVPVDFGTPVIAVAPPNALLGNIHTRCIHSSYGHSWFPEDAS